MITSQEREELGRRAREDGKRLFQVVESIYRSLIILNWFVGVIGVISALVCIVEGSGSGILVGAGIYVLGMTAVSCFVLYAAAVLTTHGAKVLVHILYSNLAIMESK